MVLDLYSRKEALNCIGAKLHQQLGKASPGLLEGKTGLNEGTGALLREADSDTDHNGTVQILPLRMPLYQYISCWSSSLQSSMTLYQQAY